MASLVTKYGQKYLKKHAKTHAAQFLNSDNVYWVEVPVQKRNGKTKIEKKRRTAPLGASEAETRILDRAMRRAYLLDQCFEIVKMPFGWSALIGIIPVIGDLLDFIMAFMVYRICCESNILEPSDKSKMVANMAIDFGVGLVPIIGDIADGVYKCNTRNVAVLQKRLEKVCLARRQDQEMAMARTNRAHAGPPPEYVRAQPRHPDAVRMPPESSRSRGWFGGQKDRDIEMGREVAPAKPPRR